MTYNPSDLPLSLRKRVVGSDLGCWIWQGSQRGGYGYLVVRQKRLAAHRHVYETLVGPIAENLTIDHLCRVTLCVNPDHLEPVTRSVNSKRADHWRRQPAPAKVAEARELRDEGLHPLDIGKRLGVSLTTVRRWLNPDEAARSRDGSNAWKKKNPDAARRSGGGSCTTCGGRTSGPRVVECQSCRRRKAEDRKRLIVERWAQGASLQDIADELGSSVSAVGVTVYAIREHHPELHDKIPYRLPRRTKPSD